MAKLTVLCQFNQGCLGCCGHDFDSLEKIKEAIKRNTQEFESINQNDELELLKFRDRAQSYDLRFGVCRNLIEKNGRLFCPLHPALHQERDLRDGHCDANHLCRTAKEFANWSPDQQKQFLQFINDKHLDNIGYSLQIENNTLLKEFLTK
ncbi:MAG TPA: hypothetical protein VJG49_01330 [Candidatus Nanoarchaeia archaeon]|nr:hypothetical protein [Candidatus Nanoarchaeia archaeon]